MSLLDLIVSSLLLIIILVLGWVIYLLVIRKTPAGRDTSPPKAGQNPLQKTEQPRSTIEVTGSRTSPPPTSDQTQRGKHLTWAGPGTSLAVKGYSIQNPLTYWSDGQVSPYDASCIDRTLPAEKSGTPLPSLPYWPRYSDLTPAQRGYYLTWLSRGRNDDLSEIGYAFIFFYGLERRGIIEGKDGDILLAEARRLLTRYPASRSFTSYVNQFVAHQVGSRLDGIREETVRTVFPALDTLEGDAPKVVLSWYWRQKRPVPWELGYSLSRNLKSSPKSTIPRKNPELLKRLFKEKFKEHFPDGLNPDGGSEIHQIEYRPASPTLLGSAGYSPATSRIAPVTIYLPTLGSDEFQTLETIWAECLDELKPLVSKLEKTGGNVTRDVYSLIPRELRRETTHPDRELWQQFIASKPPGQGFTIAKISELAGLLGIEKRDSLTAGQSRLVSSTAAEMDLVIVPEQRISGSSYKWNDSVAIIPLGEEKRTISERFPKAALIFEMAYGIAVSDDTLSRQEEEFLYQVISTRFSLSPLEITCLKGLQQVLDTQPPSLTRIGKRLSKHLKPDQKIALANFLGDIVLLDEKFVKEEQKAIKSVFKSLEIDPEESDSLIKNLLVGRTPDVPVTVVAPVKGRSGEVLPPKGITPEFSIDQDKLKKTLEDTRAVQDILASVFEQEEEERALEPEPEVRIPESPVSDRARTYDLPFPPESIPSLDIRYLTLLQEIMKSGGLSQEDFSGLAKKHNVMPRAAFDDINSWADEELGDFLLEESENRIVINYQR